MREETIGKIGLVIVLLFFCGSYIALAIISYHPEKSDINWEFLVSPDNMPSHDCVIVSTTPFDGQEISGTFPITIRYRHGSGITEWRFDDSKWFSMLYYGQGRDGVQECQGLFDTTPFEGSHSITFRIWLLNGSKLERSVNIEIQN